MVKVGFDFDQPPFVKNLCSENLFAIKAAIVLPIENIGFLIFIQPANIKRHALALHALNGLIHFDRRIAAGQQSINHQCGSLALLAKIPKHPDSSIHNQLHRNTSYAKHCITLLSNMQLRNYLITYYLISCYAVDMAGMITIKIAEVAKERDITTAYQLQKALNIPPAMAAKLWKGEFKMIGLETLNRLCNILDCEPQQILSFEPDDAE